MFEWLEAEIAKIQTPKFHLVDGPANSELRKAVMSCPIPFPASYKEFVLQFGNAKLYRSGSTYQVQVFAAPREAESEDGGPLLQVGRIDTGLVYFKTSRLVPDEESPVFEWTGPTRGLRQAASGFEEWIERKCKAARQRFSRAEWSAIEDGPEPFTDEEMAIVEARKQFRWRVVGVAANGDLQFEVSNGASISLPFLSVGIRRKNGEPIGGCWLPVSDIRPGETKIIEFDCYKDRHDPHEIEAFEEPDPEPALRDLYWEFSFIASPK